MTTAPPADGGRRGSSRRSCPAPDGAGPAAAIGVSPQGRPGRGGGKRKPGKRWKPGAFTGGATRIRRHSSPRAERRMRPVLSWRLTRVLSLLHTRLRTHRASGVPRALSTRGRDVHRTPRAQLRRENAKSCLQSLPLFDIRIRELTHGLAASPASSPRRRGPIRPVVYGV